MHPGLCSVSLAMNSDENGICPCSFKSFLLALESITSALLHLKLAWTTWKGCPTVYLPQGIRNQGPAQTSSILDNMMLMWISGMSQQNMAGKGYPQDHESANNRHQMSEKPKSKQ